MKEKKSDLYVHFYTGIEQLRQGANFQTDHAFSLNTFWQRSKFTEQKRAAIIEFCHLNYERILTTGEREVIEQREKYYRINNDEILKDEEKNELN